VNVEYISDFYYLNLKAKVSGLIAWTEADAETYFHGGGHYEAEPEVGLPTAISSSTSLPRDVS